MADRYSPDGAEAEFEPGSRQRVLRNLKGIRSVRAIQSSESEALLVATETLIDSTDRDQRFTAAEVRHLHKTWLGEIYRWAGQYRQVNLAKGDFMFAAATQIPRLMQALEKGPLREFTPCIFQDIDQQSRALGIVHAELILIHPFREGNGRCARLLSVLMGLQAGLPALDFGGIRGNEKRRYIGAIHAALGNDYEPITLIFRRVIERTLGRLATSS